MLQGEHSAILSTCIKLPFVVKIFVLSIFEWLLKTGFTVYPTPGGNIEFFLPVSRKFKKLLRFAVV